MRIKTLIGLLIIVGLSAVGAAYTVTRLPHAHQGEATHSHSNSGAITGRVIDVDGQPVHNAEVQALTTDSIIGKVPTAYTDKQGEFLIKGLAAGTYTLSVAREEDDHIHTYSPFHTFGFVDAPRVSVYEQQTTSHVVVVRLGPKAAKLVGKVVDAVTNKLVKNVKITLSRVDLPDYSYSAVPDVKGQLKILVPPVPFTIKVSAPGYEDWYYREPSSSNQADSIQLGPNTVKELSISLRPTK